jgi:hypothetical protein
MTDGVVGVGNPLSKLNGQLLSVEDEKSVDDKGNRVVDGLPWSAASTGLYLAIYGYREAGFNPRGISCTQLPGLTLAVRAGVGVPTLPVKNWGACLELPADLGRDGLKRQYLTEWVVETVKEIVTLSGSRISHPDELAAWLMVAVETQIQKTGL